MRDLKFRAWVKDEERMIVEKQDFIPLIVSSVGVLRLSALHKENHYSILPKENFELMQFIGLKDKNGKDIYEGDVLLWDTDTTVKVEFINGEFRGTQINGSINGNLSLYHFGNSEIIGNIYQNKDLIHPQE